MTDSVLSTETDRAIAVRVRSLEEFEILLFLWRTGNCFP